MAEIVFPEDFLWGAATASYQIEGAVGEGGRGESIWDRFSHTPGKTRGGETGDIACDHYHRYREDVALMRELELRAYRFSIAWPRLFPAGGGRLNHTGLDFYQRLLDELLAAGIEPLITLYHWDLPQALEDRGGWRNRDTVEYFRDYAEAVFRAMGDRVRLWVTHNEPWVTAFLGHATGQHAPGLKDFPAALQVAHHLLLSHARAVQAFREGGGAGKIGIALNLHPCYPCGDDEADREAVVVADGYHNRWFLDPVFRGRYPADMWELFGEAHGAPRIESGDLELLAAGRVDFLGVNYYFPHRVRRARTPEELYAACPPRRGEVPVTAMGWEVYPEGLTDLLLRLQAEYRPPEMFITENGAACPDLPVATGPIEDDDRIGYLRDHLLAAGRALREGVPLKGYFAWSLMDNFEWAFGTSRRFGLVHVDYATQRRSWKKSAVWYRDTIRSGGPPPADPESRP